MKYHSYQHIERYNRDEYAEFKLAPDIYVFPKIDGTAGVVTAEDDIVYCGSRNRLISVDDDNQGFAAWATSDDVEACAIREFCLSHENLHVHGEWLGQRRCIGSIKDYVRTGFWVYDVYDEVSDSYLEYDVYSTLLDDCGVKNVIPPIAKLDGYDEDKFVQLASENHFLLPPDKTGEGIVMKSYNWRDKFGKQQFMKLVLDEFRENKGKGKKKIDPGEIELSIVEVFVTSADIEKTLNKCRLVCGDDAPLHKIVGMTINGVIDDLLREEMTEIVRKYKFPKIDFSMVRALVSEKVRKYMGL